MREDAGEWVMGRITAKAKELNFDVEDYEKLLQNLKMYSSLQLNLVICSVYSVLHIICP